MNAHQGEVLRRNQDYNDISSRLFSEKGFTIFDHDFLFWMGDLNYRIDLPNNVIRDHIDRGEWESLLAHDQLYEQIKKKATFPNFLEGKINFAPTYKYDSGTDIYDTSEKKRRPAYTDRILYISSIDKADFEQFSYQRAELKTSDHKPIYSFSKITVYSIIETEKKRVHHEIVKELDKLENESMPDATLSNNNINFNDIRYGKLLFYFSFFFLYETL